MKEVLAAAMIAGIAGLTASAAQAAMITQSFDLPAIPPSSGSGTDFSTTSVNQFNPAAGTLNSVSVTTTVDAAFSGGGSGDLNEVSYELFVAHDSHFSNLMTTGNTTVSGSLNFNPPDLINFIGTGSFTPFVSFVDVAPSALVSSTFSNESVTYSFTPFTPAPEPSTLLVFAVGLLGLGWAYRKRMLPEDNHPVN